MVAIASTTASPAQAKTGTTAPPADVTVKPSGPAKPGAVVVELSDRAKALLEKAKAEQKAAPAITETFDEILARRTDALSEKLSKIFDKMNIPPEYATHMKVDKFGNVSAEGPWKEKIEKMFADFPDLAKELKEVSGLNSLKAAQVALDMYNEEKKSANSKKRQDEAWTTYNLRSINIQALSGVMTMKDGKLRSAAMDYVDMLADPNGIASGKSRKETADRLA